MAADRLDIVVELCRLQDFSQAPDMHIHGTFFKKHIGAPDVVEQLRAAESAIFVGHEKLEQTVLGGPDMGRFVREEHLS